VKYNNVKTTVDGIKFDSKGEAARYVVLRDRQTAGSIHNLQTQASYTLTVNGLKICVYRADFTYEADGVAIVEDYKSPATMTPAFRLKCKLMMACHGIAVKVVMKADAP
jgi:hypothetical protein